MTSHLTRSLAAGALIGLLPAIASAQQATTVTGRVTTETDAPLQGAGVSVPALGVGAYTDAEGRYRFIVPATQTGQSITITARRIGYQPRSNTVVANGAQLVSDFRLVATPTQLTGVVVSALGIEREKSQLGTAVQQISNEDLTTSKAQNLMTQIQGKVSGVQITGSGTQGGSVNIIIRGQNSIAGNNQPLFVVDGIPVSNSNRGGTFGNGYDYGNAISDLNPDDIESMTILKGPNAAALYGSRAANGVVEIKMKRGRATQGRMRTELSTFLTWDTPSILPEWQNQYGQGTAGVFRFVNGAGKGTCDGCDQSYGPKLDGRLIDQFTGKQQPWVAHPDNVDQFFGTGSTFSSTIAVSGGTDKANARLSVGTDQIKGYVPNNYFRKFSTLLSGNMQVTPRLTTSATVQYVRNGGINRPGTGYNNSILEQFFWFGRQVDMNALKNYKAGGLTNGGPSTREYNWNYNFHNNPYWIQESNPRSDNRDRVNGSITATYELLPGINLTGQTGSDIYRFGIDQKFAQGYINRTYVNTAYAGGFVFIDDYRNENNSSLLLTADRPLTSALRVQGTLGGNIRRETFTTKSQSSPGLLVGGVYNVSNSAVNPTLNQELRRRQVNSAYGSAALTWNNWFTLEGTARNDISSTLPSKNNSYFYPSVNASIVLSDALPMLRNNSILSYAKLRGSVAQVGNDADPYQLETTFSGLSNKLGTLPQYTLRDTLANADLKPELTHSDEAGLELGFFNGRLTFDGSVYSKYTRNQIFSVAISAASGFSNKAINAGRIENKGFEALLTVVPLQMANGFNWSSTFNFARNRNMVRELAPDVDAIQLSVGLFGDVSVEARKGEPFGVIRTPGFARDAQGRLLVSGGVPVQTDTLESFGNIQADWTGGWENTFNYRNFSLTALLDIRRGGKIVSYSNYIGDQSGVLKSSLKGREVDWNNPGVVVKGWDVDNDVENTENVPAEVYFQSLFGSLANYIYDGSYTRLREVRLGFDLPTSWTNRMNASAVSLALTGRNLWISKKIPNVDPEFVYNTGNLQGVEYAVPSNPRSLGFSVRITP